MSEKRIPEHIDPFRFAEQGLGLDGFLSLTDMPRLAAMAVVSDMPVRISLRLGVDEQGTTFLKGHLAVQLNMPCQRCLQPFHYEIISDFVLGVVATLDEANALSDHYEPVLTKEGKLALWDAIEDEIILNLPIIPRHESEACQVKLPLADAGWEQEKEMNPFHVLETLKNKQQ